MNYKFTTITNKHQPYEYYAIRKYKRHMFNKIKVTDKRKTRYGSDKVASVTATAAKHSFKQVQKHQKYYSK